MATSLPAGRRGQMLALAIAATLLLVIWFGAIAPVAALYQERDDLLQRRTELLRHMQVAAAQLPALKSQAQALAAGGSTTGFALEGSSDALAAANLQKRVQDMATALGVTLTSIDSVAAQAQANGYRRVGIRLSLTAPWQIVTGLLQSIRQSSLPMLVDDLQIRSQQLTVKNAPRNLTAELTVYAFRAEQAAGQNTVGKP